MMFQASPKGKSASAPHRRGDQPPHQRGEHLFDSLAMGLCYLLVRERRLCVSVAVMEYRGNHTKPPATTPAVSLTVALEAATLSFEVRDGGWQFWCLG
jgi:hypothetical protein